MENGEEILGEISGKWEGLGRASVLSFIGQLCWPGGPGGEGRRKGIGNATLCDSVETGGRPLIVLERWV